MIICSYETVGVKVIVSQSKFYDHDRIANAVLGIPLYTKNRYKYQEKEQDIKDQVGLILLLGPLRGPTDRVGIWQR